MQIVAKPHSFQAPQIFAVPEGLTIYEIVKSNVPVDAIVQLNGEVISQENWNIIPKEGDNIVITTSLHGGGSSKNMLEPFSQWLLLLVRVFLWSKVAGLFKGASLGANFANGLTAGFIAAAGTALVNALIPIRQPTIDTSRASPSYWDWWR
jgi:hypothetical protein